MTKIKPLFKSAAVYNGLAARVIECFPENSVEHIYLEPYAGCANVLLNKSISATEVINEQNLGIIQILKALRDEPKFFIAKVKKTKYNEKTFDEAKNNKEFDDYIDHALNELVLRRMSKNGSKDYFSDSERGETEWGSLKDELRLIAERITAVSILNKHPIQVIKAFDDKEMLCYCAVPPLSEEKGMTIDEHVKLSEVLLGFRGKVVISTFHSTMYSRLYKGWKSKKETPALKDKSEVLWMNF